MNKKIFIGFILLTYIILFCDPAYAEGNDGYSSMIIEKENTYYYLNDDGSINYAEEYKESNLQYILEFFSGTTLENANENIKYSFEINENGYIQKAIRLDQETQKVVNYYEYYSETEYGDQEKNIKYEFNVDFNGNIVNAIKKEQETQRILRYYEYYPNTRYGEHGKNIKYRFEMNESGYVEKATKREQGTQRILRYYEYYSNTKYGRHGKNIKYIFYLDYSGYISSAIKRRKETGETLVTYSYLPKTVYQKHAKNIISKKLNVPVIKQLPELPTGCEITAVTMMLQYKGINIDKLTLANQMPTHGWNPNLGYVGNPFTTKGWTIYPSALATLIKSKANSVTLLSNKRIDELEKQLSSNKPVVVWVSPMHGFSVHAIVLTGYDNDYFYYNDPWTGQKNIKIKKATFEKLWDNQKRRAISY